jgi:hypothetical protein
MAKAKQREETADATRAADRARIVAECEHAIDAWAENSLRLVAEGRALDKAACDAGEPVPNRLICIQAALRTWRELHSLQSNAVRVAMLFAAGRSPIPDDKADDIKALRAAGEHALRTIPQGQQYLRRWIAEGEKLEFELQELTRSGNTVENNHTETIAAEYNQPAMPLNTFPDLKTTLLAAEHYSRTSEPARRALLRIADAAQATTRSEARPRAKWEARKGADAKLTPPAFIAKHYAAEMAAGTLHRAMIAKEDKALVLKLISWLRSHPMPKGVDIPTLPEWNTRQLTKLPALRAAPVTREALRLDAVARMRRRPAPG